MQKLGTDSTLQILLYTGNREIGDGRGSISLCLK